MNTKYLLYASTLWAACVPGAAEPASTQVSDNSKFLDPVIVTGSHVQHASNELPSSITTVSRDRIADSQARIDLSESLAGVPGIVVQNRHNYAQDLQISSRGFGARSAFGVRGVRLYADGIPVTMPDGQGQASSFNLDLAERIEVLRGPFSALYGNHSGGVVQLFTREPGTPALESSVFGGSNGMWKADFNAEGKAANFSYLLDASRFHTDGDRPHSAADRDQTFAKLAMRPDRDTRISFIANGVRQRNTQDPLGLSWASYEANPRSVDASALVFDTHKSINHLQGGLVYEQRVGSHRLHLTAYSGDRHVTQYQAIPPAAQIRATSSGGVVDFDRSFNGIGLRWSSVRFIEAGELTTSVGIDDDRMRDNRRGYENFVGLLPGVAGALRRDEADTVSNVGPYAQAEWQTEHWGFTAGLRHSRVKMNVDDHYLSNGNDSGRVRYTHTTPVIGVVHKISPALNLYASAARGFETPTLNELFYSGVAGGFNFGLKPASSRHFEVGLKSDIGSRGHLNLALFDVHTSDELVVDAAIGGRTSYRNASSTGRQGVELEAELALRYGFSVRVAVSALRAQYDRAFGAVAAGSRIPGVPAFAFYGELAWKDTPSGLGAGLETTANSKVYVEDSNSDRAAPGYAVLNARVNAEQRAGNWRVSEFVRINNLFDRSYIGSVIVGDSNRRYYEPAPGRNWMAGVSARYLF
jgi:iron complex outermembrane receptor protein